MFDKWTGVEAKLHENLEGCNHSFVPLYVNISGVINSPRQSNRAKSYLEHEDYEHEREILNDLLSREKEHNETVSKFMGLLRNQIASQISNDDYVCKIEPPLQQSTVDLRRNYSIHLIIDHFKKEIEDYHNELRVDPTDTNQFKLHREDDNSNQIALGNRREDLECLKRKLDEYYKTNVNETIRNFLKYRKKIRDEYNTEFVPRILDISDIIEEDDLKGGCGYNFCPKKKPSWFKTKGETNISQGRQEGEE